jgi:hypothetical protein
VQAHWPTSCHVFLPLPILANMPGNEWVDRFVAENDMDNSFFPRKCRQPQIASEICRKVKQVLCKRAEKDVDDRREYFAFYSIWQVQGQQGFSKQFPVSCRPTPEIKAAILMDKNDKVVKCSFPPDVSGRVTEMFCLVEPGFVEASRGCSGHCGGITSVEGCDDIRLNIRPAVASMQSPSEWKVEAQVSTFEHLLA